MATGPFCEFCTELVSVIGEEVGEEARHEVKLNREIASRDGLHVPFQVVVLLHSLDVVKVVDHEEGNENSSRAKNKAALNSVLEIFRRDDTAELQEHLGVLSKAGASRSINGNVHVVLELLDLA